MTAQKTKMASAARASVSVKMAKISFARSPRTIDARDGANLMRALLDAGVPVASSCGGDGVCAKCRVQAIAGRANLTSPTPRERSLAVKEGLLENERLSCQCRIRGDLTLDASYW